MEERDNEDDPSLLRFLVDMRGEDVSSMVLRDDLMTMLIAGHETTAAMLTWTLFELAQGDPGLLREVQAEVRTVLKGKDRPDYDDLVAMKKLRYCLIEALRLYPEPPLLIRRARTEDTLPAGSSGLRMVSKSCEEQTFSFLPGISIGVQIFGRIQKSLIRPGLIGRSRTQESRDGKATTPTR